MAESTDYKAFRRNMPKPNDRLERIENLVGVGQPDTNYCAAGKECWIEFKSPKEPKRHSTPLFGSNHRLSQDQMNWFLKQRNAGGVGFVLIVTDKRWILVDGCKYGDDINDMTVGHLLDVAEWYANKPLRKDDWINLRTAIII